MLYWSRVQPLAYLVEHARAACTVISMHFELNEFVAGERGVRFLEHRRR